jgi:homoserine kinase type II
MTATPEARDVISNVLTTRYGLSPQQLVQLPIGQGTTNYRATCAEREVFVKNYPNDADLDGERNAIALSDLAHQHGIPVAGLVPNHEGDAIDTSSFHPISVWEWAPGETITGMFSPDRLHAAGHALGAIHTTFATHPASATPSLQAAEWLAVDVPDITRTIDHLLGLAGARIDAGIADAFDDAAHRTLLERRDTLKQIPILLAGLPPLTTQVLHGDYSPVNLLFDGQRLSAVVDFRPPDPFFIAYELGRMAFYPNTVTQHTDWLGDARILISAYLQAKPSIEAADILACARVALLQLLTSLYGVKQHYLKPGLFQDDLDEFWLLRHRAVSVLLDRQADTDALLHDLLKDH